MFEEMYLQKCEEYCGGEITGAIENNELRITRIYDHRIETKMSIKLSNLFQSKTLMVN